MANPATAVMTIIDILRLMLVLPLRFQASSDALVSHVTIEYRKNKSPFLLSNRKSIRSETSQNQNLPALPAKQAFDVERFINITRPPFVGLNVNK
jgi:hypothetical protein